METITAYKLDEEVKKTFEATGEKLALKVTSSDWQGAESWKCGHEKNSCCGRAISRCKG